MRNWIQKNLDWEARHLADNWIYGGGMATAMYVIGILDRDATGVTHAVGFLGLVYVLYSPYLVRRVAVRAPPGDMWRAAAFVAYGALPFGLFIPFWSVLTAWPVSLAVFPLLAVWAGGALTLAASKRPEMTSPPRRSAFLAVAGAIFAVAAGPIYLGFAIAFVVRAWVPPDDSTILTLVAFVIGLPFACLATYAAIELLGRANRSETAPEPV